MCIMRKNRIMVKFVVIFERYPLTEDCISPFELVKKKLCNCNLLTARGNLGLDK